MTQESHGTDHAADATVYALANPAVRRQEVKVRLVRLALDSWAAASVRKRQRIWDQVIRRGRPRVETGVLNVRDAALWTFGLEETMRMVRTPQGQKELAARMALIGFDMAGIDV